MHIDIPLTIYLLTSVVACYGLSIFIYWWSTIGKATTIFMYVTALFFSILFENVAFFFLRLLFYNDLDTHSYIVLLKGQYIGIFGIPLLVVLFLIVFTMTKRIIRTNKAIMAIKDYEKPKECANKVLVITNPPFDSHSWIGGGMSQAISVCLDGVRRREAKVSEIGGKDGLRPLPTVYTAIAEINRFRFKRNMPEHMVLSPDLFKSRYYTPLWGNRRFKAAREADRE